MRAWGSPLCRRIPKPFTWTALSTYLCATKRRFPRYILPFASAIEMRICAACCPSCARNQTFRAANRSSRNGPHRAIPVPVRCSLARGIEALGEFEPTLHVVLLQCRRPLQRRATRLEDEAALEHEGHRVGDLLRLSGVCRQSLLKRRRIGPVRAHTIVDRGAARHESPPLSVLDSMNQPHKFTPNTPCN